MKFEINEQVAPRPRKKISRLSIIILIVILLCFAGVAANFTILKHTQSPFPADIADGLSYSVYYTPDNTNGYSYRPGTAKVQAGILFFTMQNGPKKRIFITEQALPSHSINFSSLPKHTGLDVPIGRAIIGTGLGNPSVIIVTTTTLIQLTSSKAVSQSDVSSVAQKMTLLSQTSNQY